MSWNQILSHESARERFQRSVQRNRLASTYLFVGPTGIGKRMFALKLAEALLCQSNPDSALDPCGVCPDCQQVQAKTHPDLILVSKPKNKAFIPVETFIGDKEHRRQEGLCHDIGLKPFRGGRKIAIIDDADFLNQEGANSLLKTLEEPPPQSMLILIGTSEQRQLSTIVSRSQVVRFEPLTNSQVLSILQDNELIETPEVPLENLASASAGSVALAVELSDPDTFDFRKLLFSQLASGDPGKSGFASAVSGFVDAAGKDSAKKRVRLALVGDFSISFYRQWYMQLAGANVDPDRADPSLAGPVGKAISSWSSDINSGADVAAQCIERTTVMQRHIFSNAGTPNIVESWLRDLGRICRGEYSAA
ncbi:MAG: ATP-binding protein [Mariniblastus sp.]